MDVVYVLIETGKRNNPIICGVVSDTDIADAWKEIEPKAFPASDDGVLVGKRTVYECKLDDYEGLLDEHNKQQQLGFLIGQLIESERKPIPKR